MKNGHLSDDQIQELLDARTGRSATILPIHLGVCANCRERLENFRQLYAGLAADPGFMLPETFADSVLNKLPASRPPFWMRPALCIALAVSIFILVLTGLFIFVDMKPLADGSIRIAGSSAAAFRPLLAQFRQLLAGSNGYSGWFMLGGLGLLSAALIDRLLQRHTLHRGH